MPACLWHEVGRDEWAHSQGCGSVGKWGVANISHGGEPHEGMEGEGRSGGSWEGGLSCFCLSGCAGWETGACWTGGPPRSSKDMWTLSQKS